jgi:RNA polymerase sigma-70 factor, ECF subfamily
MEDDDVLNLANRAAEGDREAVDALLEHTLPELRAFVRLRAGPLLRARETESDLVQSVCREVLHGMERFQHPSETAFKRWLYTTAMRKIVNKRDYYRAQKRDVLRERNVDMEAGGEELLNMYRRFSSPSEKLMAAEECERIERAFSKLPEDQREIILLARFVGMSRAEIAAEQGKSEGAVRVALHRALARLAEVLAVDEPTV